MKKQFIEPLENKTKEKDNEFITIFLNWNVYRRLIGIAMMTLLLNQDTYSRHKNRNDGITHLIKIINSEENRKKEKQL